MRKFWYYELPTIREPRFCGWARVFIFEDGLVMCASDYGTHSHYWGAPGPKGIRHFFATVNDSYLIDKFMYGRERVYDGDATQKRVREQILEYRKLGDIDKAEARVYWDELSEEFGSLSDRDDFRRWYENSEWCSRFPDSHEDAVTMPQGEVLGFVEVVMPRLREAIRAQLSEESRSSPAAAASCS